MEDSSDSSVDRRGIGTGRKTFTATYLEGTFDRAACVVKDVLQTLTTCRSLVGNTAFDQFATGISWNLARHVDVRANENSLRLKIVSVNGPCCFAWIFGVGKIQT